MSGFEKGTVGFEPVGIVPASENFAFGSACPADALNAAHPATLQPGMIPSIFAIAGSIVPPAPVAAAVGAPQDAQAAVFGARKLLISVRPTTFALPRTRFRNAVR